MDLAALMASLQTTQQAKSTVKLSERNVVELVNKLKSLGLLGVDLLYTINGKEYVTTGQLKSEIQGCLEQAGGRLPLVELPALVGVDLVHCERQAAALAAGSGGEIVEVQGELVTTMYFDLLATELNDLLQEAGVMSLADIAVQYCLSADLLIKTISKRMGTLIKGHMEGGLVYTEAFLRNVKAQLRGALRGCTGPVVVKSLVKELEGVGGGVVPSLIEELIAEGSTKGTLKSGGVSWTPAIHAEAQTGAVVSFFEQNGWIEYSTVKKVGISNEKKYLQDKFPEGIALETAFVSASILAQVEGAVDEALSGDTWVDVSALLPSVLTDADTLALLKKVPALSAEVKAAAKAEGGGNGAKPHVLASSYVISPVMVTAMQEKVDSVARQAAEKAIAERRVPGSSAGPAPATSGGGRPQQGGGGDSDDEDWGLGKKGGKKGGKGAKGAKGGSAKAGAAGGKSSKGAASAPEAGLLLSEVQSVVLEMYAELEDSSESELVVEELAKLLQPGSVLAYESALKAVLTAGAEDRRRARDSVAKCFEESFHRLALYSHGVDVFSSDEAMYSLLQKHLLREVGTECVELLFQFAKAEYQTEEEGSDTSTTSTTLPAAARNKLLKMVPSDVASSLNKASDLMSSSSSSEVEAGLEKAASDVGIRLKKFDKKVEKAAVQAAKERMLEALVSEQEPAAALTLLVSLLFIKANSKVIMIPGKAIAPVLSKLKEQLPEETVTPVVEAHAQVFEYLKALSSDTAKAEALAQELSAQLPKLKALVTEAPAAAAAES